MKTPSQPRAIYYIVAIQIWEYFSFYGMRALLILYLTHQLGFDDNHAISLLFQRICFSGLRYPYSRRLACRPPARQPHCSDCRRAVNAALLAMWCWALIQIQPLACIWRWQSLFVATVYSNQTSAVCLASSTTRTIIDVMSGFSLLYAAGRCRVYQPPPIALPPGCSVVWMACSLCPCGWRHVYRFVDFLKRASSLPVHA